MKQPVAPTRDDAVVAPLSEVIGGPSGTRSAGHAWWTPVRVLLVLTAVAMALAMVKSTACANDSWADGEARYTHMCYSDLPYLYTGRGMAELHWPYIDEPEVRARYEAMEYPVGISYAAWVSAWMTHVWSGSPDLDRRAGLDPGALFGDPEVLPEINRFVVVNALWFTLLAMLSTWLLAGVHRRRPWDAAGFALAPALVLTVLINWDMWAVVCVAGVLWAWSRDRPWLTGLLVGVGTAVKLYPLFLLGGVLVICLRRRRWAAFGQAVAGAVLGWTALNLPAVLTGPDDWRVFWSFNSDRGADLGSVWLLLSQVFDVAFTAHTINLWSWVFFIAWCFGVLVLGWRAPLTPRLAQLGFLDRRRLPAGQQGLLTAVRALAAAPGRAGPPALARSADLAGGRGGLLRSGVVVSRRSAGAGGGLRCDRLLGGDHPPAGRRGLPDRDRGARRAAPRPRPGAGRPVRRSRPDRSWSR